MGRKRGGLIELVSTNGRMMSVFRICLKITRLHYVIRGLHLYKICMYSHMWIYRWIFVKYCSLGIHWITWRWSRRQSRERGLSSRSLLSTCLFYGISIGLDGGVSSFTAQLLAHLQRVYFYFSSSFTRIVLQ